MSQITMRQMIEAGVHFGHQTRYWNPKMAQYIFGARNKIHIINLEKTVPLFQEAQEVVRRLVANKGTVLFVGTKRQAREIIKEEAQRAGMPYVDYRWLGGMLTNYKTVKQSIKRLEEKTAILANAESSGYNKKELLDMTREVEKLERSLGGIKEMKGLPDAIFVIDTGYQHGTLVEAAKLGIPVIVSVLVFIVYYILDNSGYQMSRRGIWTVWFGRSLAPGVLVPVAIFVTYKANKDSVVFNLDAYRHFFRKFLGLRIKRNISGKEVIINEPDYRRDADLLAEFLGFFACANILGARGQHGTSEKHCGE